MLFFFTLQSNDGMGFVSHKLSRLNRFWAVEITPFNKKWRQGDHDQEVTVNILMRSNLSHRDGLQSRWVYEKEQIRQKTVRCPLISRSAATQGRCSSFSMVFERKIRHPYRGLEFKLTFEKTSPVVLGDVGMEIVTGTRGFGQFELAYTILFTAGSVVAVAVYVVALRHEIKARTLSFEQAFTLVLGIGILFYDNPFFVAEYIGGSIIAFNVFDTLFKNAFIMLLLLFWLMIAERFASPKTSSSSSSSEGGRMSFINFSNKSHVMKFALAFAYFVLSFITTTWTSAREREDPIKGSSITYPGVLTFYIFTVVIIVVTIAWVLYMAVQSIPYVTSSQFVFTRFCFFAIPSFIVALSLFIGSITGSFGGITRTSKYIFNI